jgi:cysteine desulfurase
VWQNSVMKRTYLDYAASTPVDNRVAEMMMPLMTVSFGNPSAIHFDGLIARRAIEDAREKIARVLGVSRTTCIFTSSATESIGLAFLGAIAAWKKNHKDVVPEVVLSPIEHEAVRSFAHMLEEEGVLVKYLPVNEFGSIAPHDVFDHLTKQTVFVSVGLVNNEIGTIQPIAEIAKEIRRFKKNERGVTRDKSTRGDDIYPLLHTDATQAVNYHDMNVHRLGVDLLSCNSTKIYGPKGIGLLYRGPHVFLESHLVGGGQEFGLRSGHRFNRWLCGSIRPCTARCY